MQEMAAKLGFKIFAALLVMVPIITMFMVIGLERNYVEQLKDEQSAMLAQRSAVHKRSPLGQAQDQDSANYYREVSSPKKHIDGKHIDGLSSNRNDLSHQAQVLYKNASPVETVGIQNISPGPEFYEMLKERKTYELRMEKSMQESWWYIRSQLEMLKSGKIQTNHIASYLTDTLNSMNNQYSYARKWYRELKHSGSDSTVQQYWQKNVSMEMQSLMQKRLVRLQNPEDCDTARKLVCQVGKTCGFGCQMHHVSYCFILAYASERTLVLESHGWSYSAKGWDSVFLPVSPCPVPATGKVCERSCTVCC